ncbi:hypothetical protein ElyMa_001615300 [Elysia marginata]|uniref:Ig-like domain-containing protein n=1 Tax=Elysia marginata TaxID=1093978 RepID=A0AAV4JP60_9GAST|nr:hypothetical protein ElyMa_001615300 [Elysia marginata]
MKTFNIGKFKLGLKFQYDSPARDYNVNESCSEAGFFKCWPSRQCIHNKYVCDNETHCSNAADEASGLCKLQILKDTRTDRVATFQKMKKRAAFKIFCVARYEDQIKWYFQRWKNSEAIDINKKVKGQNCPSDRCRLQIQQAVRKGERTYMSTLSFLSLQSEDFGIYTCRMLDLRSEPFQLDRIQSKGCRQFLRCNKFLRYNPDWRAAFPLRRSSFSSCNSQTLIKHRKCRDMYETRCHDIEDKALNWRIVEAMRYICHHTVRSDVKDIHCWTNADNWRTMQEKLAECNDIPSPEMTEQDACL